MRPFLAKKGANKYSHLISEQTMDTNTPTSYWQLRLHRCSEALDKNNFSAFIAQDPEEAKEIILQQILPDITVRTASWGDSQTLRSTGILELIDQDSSIELIKTFDSTVSREEIIERRRRALLVDLFFSGSNAVTECGKLVNLDMVGNRTAGITFGPRHVVLCIGRNKIVPNVERAMERIKNQAAPMNAIRHPGFKTPCVTTSYCADCSSPDRICNTWTITEKSYPKARIKVILINQDLGL